MKKINVNYIYLEVTRRCNLECKHCLRGNCENVDMNLEMLDKIFRNVSHIRELDIGGGEPFLAPNLIDEIIKKIEQYGISVDRVSLTTNGTVLSDRIIDLMTKISNNGKRKIFLRVSHDIFHFLEIYKKGLLDKFTRNKEKFKELFDYDPLKQAFVADDGKIYRIGRAKNLTQEEMDGINKFVKLLNKLSQEKGNSAPIYPLYRLSDMPDIENESNPITLYDYEEDDIKVAGSVVISAKGNLTRMDQEYATEDERPVFGININDYPSLSEALIEYEVRLLEHNKNK